MPKGSSVSLSAVNKGDNTMTRYELNTPFFVGLEKHLRELESVASQKTNYPPYDLIEEADGVYKIRFAVSGFTRDEVAVALDRRILTVKGEQSAEDLENVVKYHHRGISKKKFQRKFTLGEFTEVTSVRLADGILTVTLEQVVPEDKKPKTFDIQ